LVASVHTGVAGRLVVVIGAEGDLGIRVLAPVPLCNRGQVAPGADDYDRNSCRFKYAGSVAKPPAMHAASSGLLPMLNRQLEYEAKDEFKLADFIERLRLVQGELCLDADYIRGRRIKTRIAVRANGTVRLETIGRGKAVLRWLERMKVGVGDADVP